MAHLIGKEFSFIKSVFFNISVFGLPFIRIGSALTRQFKTLLTAYAVIGLISQAEADGVILVDYLPVVCLEAPSVGLTGLILNPVDGRKPMGEDVHQVSLKLKNIIPFFCWFIQSQFGLTRRYLYLLFDC